MERELIALKKKLYDLDDIEGDVWGQINDWEKEFRIFVSKNKNKYSWCEDEFEKIHSQNKRRFPKDSYIGYKDSFKKLFAEIEKRE